jgi:putative nucleotidyltransferase with HDIG domain
MRSDTAMDRRAHLQTQSPKQALQYQRAVEVDAMAKAVLALVDVLALRDIETAFHCYRVRAYACHLCTVVAPHLFDDPTLELGFLLHDIGKLALPDTILQKPGSLTTSERQLMQTHASLGAEMALRFLPRGAAINVIRSHHERWDGTGYPDQLKCAAIPLEARIFAIADALDAITSNRPYRCATPWHEAVEILAADTGTHFDSTVADALTDQAMELQRLRDRLCPEVPPPRRIGTTRSPAIAR